jgi:phospholipid/cholesterol/gamma-HCH transport system substrate-binding protein
LLRHSRQIRRAAAAAALAVAVIAVAYVLVGDDGDSYTVTARYENASQLVKGNEVQVAGKAIGTVEDIRLAPNGGADVDLKITDAGYTPLRRGTQAIVRLTSLSGVANRFVDLHLGPGDKPVIEENGHIGTQETTSAVELDQLLDTLDKRTRTDLQGVIQGFGKQYDGKVREAQRGWLYLNPSLVSTSRLFSELTRDTPAFEQFIVASSKLVTDLADRREDLAGLVDDLADTTGAIGREKDALADAISQLPPFMRRANTTFVNLRAAIDDLRPLIRESKPVTPKLRRFLAELRPLARDARPTLRDLSKLVSDAGPDNDLLELTKGQVPLRNIALGPVQANGKERKGAFEETVDALRKSVPELAYARPYAVDLTGWFDDFGHSGIYDAVGGKSRVGTYLNAFANVEGVVKPIPVPLRNDAGAQVTATGQRNRCPGGAEFPAPDKSNPWKPAPDYNCDPSQLFPGATP